MALFNFTKTLEELDGMDISRLGQALEAAKYEKAFSTLNALKVPSREEAELIREMYKLAGLTNGK